MGGVLASPVVKAVLDALGVSYVVEQGQDESGSWYRRFSNGWVEQGGSVEYVNGNPIQNVVFPIAFNSSAYSVTIGGVSEAKIFGTASLAAAEDMTTTGMNIHLGSHLTNAIWEAKGFAA